MEKSAKEGFSARAATLSAAALRLKRAHGAAAPFALAFLTDDARKIDAVAVACALPAGAALILRDYSAADRAARAERLAAICAKGGVRFLVGGDAEFAGRFGAAGVHLRADQLAAAPRVPPGLLVTASCHDEKELALAARAGAAAVLLGPVFETLSHPGARTLGPAAFRRLAEASPRPVLALGGVDETNADELAGPNVAGFGAIGAFAPR